MRVVVCAHRSDGRIAGLSDVSGPERRNSKLDALWLFDALPTKDRTQTQERSFPVFYRLVSIVEDGLVARTRGDLGGMWHNGCVRPQR